MGGQLNMQALDALARGNEVRSLRAADKKQIGVGRLQPSTVLRSLPGHWNSASLVDLLLAMPSVGKKKATRWAQLADVGLETQLQDLSLRERFVLANQLDAYMLARDELRGR